MSKRTSARWVKCNDNALVAGDRGLVAPAVLPPVIAAPVIVPAAKTAGATSPASPRPMKNSSERSTGLQWSCALCEIPRRPDPNGLREGPQREPGQGRMAHPRGCRKGRADCLGAGTLPFAVLLPGGKRGPLRPGRTCAGADQRELFAAGPRALGGHRRVGLRAANRGGVSQYRAGPGCGWRAARDIPEDAHSRRPPLLREILFHTRGSGLSLLRYAVCPGGRVGLLGPVVSRSGPDSGPGGGAGAVLSHGHRVASLGEGPIR